MMSEKAQAVFEKISALRTLTRTSGVITNRTQKNLLLTLSDDELAEVAKALDHEAAIAVLSGTAVGGE